MRNPVFDVHAIQYPARAISGRRPIEHDPVVKHHRITYLRVVMGQLLWSATGNRDTPDVRLRATPAADKIDVALVWTQCEKMTVLACSAFVDQLLIAPVRISQHHRIARCGGVIYQKRPIA